MEVLTINADNLQILPLTKSTHKEVHILLKHSWVTCDACGIWIHCKHVQQCICNIINWVNTQSMHHLQVFALKYNGYADRSAYVQILHSLNRIRSLHTVVLPSLPYQFINPMLRPIQLYLFHDFPHMSKIELTGCGEVIGRKSPFDLPVSNWYIRMYLDEIEFAEILLHEKCISVPVLSIQKEMCMPYHLRCTREELNYMRAACTLFMLWKPFCKDMVLHILSFLRYTDWKNRKHMKTLKTSKYAAIVHQMFKLGQVEDLHMALDVYRSKRRRIKI